MKSNYKINQRSKDHSSDDLDESEDNFIGIKCDKYSNKPITYIYRLIVDGYIRKIEPLLNLYSSFAKELYQIVYIFYPKIKQFKWNQNPTENAGGYEFLANDDHDGSTFKYIKRGYSLLKSNNIISFFTAQTVKWGIKILDIHTIFIFKDIFSNWFNCSIDSGISSNSAI